MIPAADPLPSPPPATPGIPYGTSQDECGCERLRDHANFSTSEARSSLWAPGRSAMPANALPSARRLRTNGEMSKASRRP